MRVKTCRSYEEAPIFDITRVLLAASANQRARSSEGSLRLLKRVRAVVGGDVDWDEQAGEDWATLGADDRIIAQVDMEAPLVMVTSEVAEAVRLEAGDGVALVVVDDWDADDLRASEDAIAAVFGDEALTGELDPKGFAASDLWFSTISMHGRPLLGDAVDGELSVVEI